jgi:hypothetical protein
VLIIDVGPRFMEQPLVRETPHSNACVRQMITFGLRTVGKVRRGRVIVLEFAAGIKSDGQTRSF